MIFSVENLISFFILVLLEIILGIDNVIFVSIILNKLNKSNQQTGRLAWVSGGIFIRILLLFGLGWLLAQKNIELLNVLGKGFDLSSLVMLAGGIFLIYKTVKEIHHKMEEREHQDLEETRLKSKKHLSLFEGIPQILLIDTVFSFDSIITAGGTASNIYVMITAVTLTMIAMFFFSPIIASFIQKHPTLKMLAMSFLVMIGFTLVVEGWDHKAAEGLHLKNYVYFAMAFSFAVELMNMQSRKKSGNQD